MTFKNENVQDKKSKENLIGCAFGSKAQASKEEIDEFIFRIESIFPEKQTFLPVVSQIEVDFNMAILATFSIRGFWINIKLYC